MFALMPILHRRWHHAHLHALRDDGCRAADRDGIARAVGAQRINLVQSFLAEGVVYDLLAGAIGVVLGVAAAFLLVLLGVRFLIGNSSTSSLRA
jgi:predicted lysophospholipase L1 biosynthesis ABC-type transport system permease subunit